MTMDEKIAELRKELKNLSAKQLNRIKEMMFKDLDNMYMYAYKWNIYQSKFQNSVRSLDLLSTMNIKKNATLIKLSDRIFIEGKIIKPFKVLIFLGDGYFAKMRPKDGVAFFKRKLKKQSEDAINFEAENNMREMILIALDDALDKSLKDPMRGINRKITIKKNLNPR